MFFLRAIARNEPSKMAALPPMVSARVALPDRIEYASNNGQYTLGRGVASFDTRWSKANNKSIRAHKDGPNIESQSRSLRSRDGFRHRAVREAIT